MFQNLLYLPVLIILTAFKGGFSEELWRVFYLTKFEKRWGKTGLILAVAVGTIIFALGHLYQGIGGMTTVGIVGLLYTFVYLRKRLAPEVVIAHATYDVVAVILGFLIYYGK